ncbi:LPXTG-motif cell wall anchor domain protein [Actinobacteria bacterium OK074]|nr:LPXTG-motif cell wall anchor domain protein [Actinobacteria bacterium OK074]
MSAVRRSSSATRRSLLTATAAGTVLAALWFVPTARATPPEPVRQETSASPTTGTDTTVTVNTTDTADTADTSADTATASGTDATGAQLADTGSIDTTPYVVGGTLFLGLGAGFVVFSVRRERMEELESLDGLDGLEGTGAF